LTTYSSAILEGYRYLLANHPRVFCIGQGLWSPWYVGETMTGLEKEFGGERIIDTPVSEQACTGMALGAALTGYRPVVTHPRMDFAVLALDQIVNQAAKWSSMFGGQTKAPVTYRLIINRGGEQGAQHSQALHGWLAHIPGLRVVMPATPADARDLLVAAVMSDDPVAYIDDRWLYALEQDLQPIRELDLRDVGPSIVAEGSDITLVGAGYSALLCVRARDLLAADGISCEVIDLRVLNPLDTSTIVDSVMTTGRLCVVDGGWRTCGVAGEVMASVAESVSPATWRTSPFRVCLPDAPAPTSKALEEIYYPQPDGIRDAVMAALEHDVKRPVR
jgi:pyruvate dehydrogenase E1 component beta subunit